MDLHQTRLALAKQRQINLSLTARLRVETILSNALAKLVYQPSAQTPHKLARVRHALELKARINHTPPATKAA